MKHWMRLAWIGLIALAAGCSSTPTPEIEPAELQPFTAERILHKRWSQQVGGGLGESGIRLQPWVAETQVFAADVEGTVMAFDRKTGERQWRVELDVPVSGGLGGDAEQLYLGTLEGEVIALNQGDGSIQWQAPVSSEVLAAPQGNRQLVVAQTVDGKLFGLDRNTGEQRWSHNSVIPALSLRGTAAPLVTGEATFAGFSNGKLTALNNRRGQVIWEQRIALPQGRTDIERLVDVDGQPRLEQGALYATSYQGNVVALDARNGQRRWHEELSSYQSPALGFGNLYVAGADSHLVALDSRSGTSVWVQDKLEGRSLTAPVTIGNYVAVADFEGYVHLLAQVDGHLAARRQLDRDGIRAPLTVVDETLYVLTNDGHLMALEVQPLEAE